MTMRGSPAGRRDRRSSPSPSTEPFWAAAAEHRLVVPRCIDVRHVPASRPTPFCWKCRAQDVDWIEHDGSGAIYSFTVIRHAVIPQVADALPFIAAVVELPGHQRLPPHRQRRRLRARRRDDRRCRSTLDWYDVREGTSVPVFRLA